MKKKVIMGSILLPVMRDVTSSKASWCSSNSVATPENNTYCNIKKTHKDLGHLLKDWNSIAVRSKQFQTCVVVLQCLSVHSNPPFNPSLSFLETGKPKCWRTSDWKVAEASVPENRLPASLRHRLFLQLHRMAEMPRSYFLLPSTLPESPII